MQVLLVGSLSNGLVKFVLNTYTREFLGPLYHAGGVTK